MVKSVKELSFTQKEKHHNQISPLSPYYQYAAKFNTTYFIKALIIYSLPRNQTALRYTHIVFICHSRTVF